MSWRTSHRGTRRAAGLDCQPAIAHARLTVIVSDFAAELGSGLSWVAVRLQTSVAAQDHWPTLPPPAPRQTVLPRLVDAGGARRLQ
jgi:hypothetical protein